MSFELDQHQLAQNVDRDDLAQCDDRILVVVAVDGKFLAAAQVARALRGEQNQLEAVGNLLDAVFDSDARHALGLRALNSGKVEI